MACGRTASRSTNATLRGTAHTSCHCVCKHVFIPRVFASCGRIACAHILVCSFRMCAFMSPVVIAHVIICWCVHFACVHSCRQVGQSAGAHVASGHCPLVHMCCSDFLWTSNVEQSSMCVRRSGLLWPPSRTLGASLPSPRRSSPALRCARTSSGATGVALLSGATAASAS